MLCNFAFFLLQLYPKEPAAGFGDLRGSPCPGDGSTLAELGTSPPPPGHRHTAKVPRCAFWGGDSPVHHSNGLTGLFTAQAGTQGREQTSTKASIAASSTCTSEHDEGGRQPQPR